MSQKAKDYAADSAVMQTYGRAEIGFERSDGSWLISETGDRYLDYASGIAVLRPQPPAARCCPY